MGWQLIHLDTPEATRKALAVHESNSGTDGMAPQQDMTWFLDGERSIPPSISFLRRFNRERGNLPSPAPLATGKGDPGRVVVYRYPTNRFELWSSPVLHPQGGGSSEQMLKDLLDDLDDLLTTGESLSIEGLPTDSELHRYLTQPNPRRLLVQLGNAFMHQSIAFRPTSKNTCSK